MKCMRAVGSAATTRKLSPKAFSKGLCISGPQTKSATRNDPVDESDAVGLDCAIKLFRVRLEGKHNLGHFRDTANSHGNEVG